MDTIDRPISATDAAARLLIWLSPAFPVGAYSYSHGLEQAVEAGFVSDRATLVTWIEGVLRLGAGRTDGLFQLAAHRAVAACDHAALLEIAELATAMRGSAELALESTAQGAAFVKAIGSGWPHLAHATALRNLQNANIAYPVAVGIIASLNGIGEEISLQAYLTSFCSSLVSAAMRLAPIGQSDGIAALAGLEPVIGSSVERLRRTPFETVGSAALMVDWCSMKHETQETRLFRS